MSTVLLKGNSGADIRLITKLAEKMNIDALPLSLIASICIYEN